MSDNNNAALALFAECDSLFQDLSATDESAISGGWKKCCGKKGGKRGGKGRGKGRGRKFAKKRNDCPPVFAIPAPPGQPPLVPLT